MKKILILVLFTSGLFASVGLDIDYTSSFLSFTRGGEDQEVISREEINGELVDEKAGVYESDLDEATTMMRLYNSAAVSSRLSKNIRVYTRFRQAYGFYEDDMYTPFALNRFYAVYKADKLKLKAGRFFAADRSIRRSVDGASADIKLSESMQSRLLYGALAPSVYGSDVAPDFYGDQFVLAQQTFTSASLGKIGLNYTFSKINSGDKEDEHELGAFWRTSMAGTYISAYGEYLITAEKIGNSVLNMTRNFGSRLLVNLDYRVVLQQDWVLDHENDIYFSGNAYDVLRIGAFYEITDHFGFEVSRLRTMYRNDTYCNTYLELLTNYGGIGLVHIDAPHGSELNASAKLNYGFMKDALKVQAGYNYITEELNYHETETVNGSGTYLGLNYQILKGLDAGFNYFMMDSPFNYFMMDSPQYDSHSRLLFNLNYRLSL